VVADEVGVVGGGEEGEGLQVCTKGNARSARRGLRLRPRSPSCFPRNLGELGLLHFLSPTLCARTPASSSRAMPKRKRGAGQDEPSEGERKKAAVERQIVLGKRELTKNLKLAKGFERQKLGRREKDARAKKAQADVTKLELEIAALKVRKLSSFGASGDLLTEQCNTGGRHSCMRRVTSL
jgi:hypothetical protein